jgi:probable F420-dependent oxidoreductase
VRPFQFVVGTRRIVDGPALIERARAAEATGYSHIAIHDHLEPQLAPIPTLSVVAAATERLGLMPLVMNNDLRHPAVLAQELATLDVLSGGRVVAGIGAGWNEPEYAAAGIEFDPPSVRIARMTEAIAILRGLFADSPFSFSGRFYTVTELDGQPKPIQKPHPPFLVGGTREKVLRQAAREGDIVGIDLRQDRDSIAAGFPAGMDRRVGWIREEAGPRFDDLDVSVLRLLGGIHVTDNSASVAREVTARYEAQTGLAIDPNDILESPFALIGSKTELIDRLRANRERWGINQILVGWFDEPAFPDIAPVVEALAGT